MSKGWLIALGIIGTATILPIWRGAGHSQHDGISFWRLLHESTNDLKYGPFGHPHITYTEALERARIAYDDARLAQYSVLKAAEILLKTR